MGVRQIMWMRCTVERNQETKDQYGQKVPGWTAVLEDQSCYFWVKSGSARIDDGGIVSTDQVVGLFPKGADILEHDRINKVKDRQGNELFGVLIIDAVLKRRDHVEVRTRDHA